MISKMKKAVASLIVLSAVLSCSTESSINELDPSLNQQTNISSVDEPVDESLVSRGMPVIASFNNAYKGLLTENEPIGRADKKNPDKYFLSLIYNAKQTLDGAFYDLQDPAVVRALIRAKKKGVNVRLVTDDANMMDKTDPTKPRQSIIDLRAAGITVKDDKRQKLMHHKFMVVDNTYVWTGSMNLTTSSIYHHNNNSIMFRSKQLAENFNAEFKRMYEQGIFDVNPHEMPYKEVDVSGMKVKTYFSPGGNTMSAIVEELKKAQKSIKFMAFSMTSKDILQVMADKKTQGLKVEGVFDSCLIPQYSIYWDLRKAKVMALRDGNQALMHHKTIIIDDETVVTGSFNFSKSADQGNNENCVIIKSPGLAQQYSKEYFRIRTAAFDNKNLPDYDHPACGKHDTSNQPAEVPVPAKPVNNLKPIDKIEAE